VYVNRLYIYICGTNDDDLYLVKVPYCVMIGVCYVPILLPIGAIHIASSNKQQQK
jgi:hypothetical protein